MYVVERYAREERIKSNLVWFKQKALAFKVRVRMYVVIERILAASTEAYG